MKVTSIGFSIFVIINLCHLLRADNKYIDRKFVKCLVCQRVIEELFKGVMKDHSSLTYDIGSYVLDDNIKRPPVDIRKSDLYLVEVMENICKRMDEYVRAYNKSTGLLEVIPLIINGNVNPELQEYDIVKDGDLESLTFYCDSIISEYEEEIIELFKLSERNIVHKICYSTEVCMNFNSDSSSLHNEL